MTKKERLDYAEPGKEKKLLPGRKEIFSVVVVVVISVACFLVFLLARIVRQLYILSVRACVRAEGDVGLPSQYQPGYGTVPHHTR